MRVTSVYELSINFQGINIIGITAAGANVIN